MKPLAGCCWWRVFRALAPALLLSACASTGALPARPVAPPLPALPLTAAAAAEHAVRHNPQLAAQAAALGLAEADRLDAARFAPQVQLSLADSTDPAALTRRVSGELALGLSDLLLRGARIRHAQWQYDAARLHHIQATQALAAETHAAWAAAAAGEALHALRQRAADTAQLSAALAQRYAEAGNLDARTLALENATAAEAAVAAARAATAAGAARSALATLLGLPTDSLGPLAPLPQTPLPAAPPLDGLRAQALQSPQLQSLRLVAAARHDALQLARRWRWLGAVEAGFEVEREFDNHRSRGPVLSVRLPPLWGADAAIVRAQAQADAAAATLAAAEQAAHNTLADAHARYGSARQAVARLRDTLLPLRAAVLAHTQERQAFMLDSLFAVILARQQLFDAEALEIETRRDALHAQAALQAAVSADLFADPEPSSAPPEARP